MRLAALAAAACLYGQLTPVALAAQAPDTLLVTSGMRVRVRVLDDGARRATWHNGRLARADADSLVLRPCAAASRCASTAYAASRVLALDVAAGRRRDWRLALPAFALGVALGSAAGAAPVLSSSKPTRAFWAFGAALGGTVIGIPLGVGLATTPVRTRWARVRGYPPHA